MTLIIQANNQSDKQQALRVLRDHLEELLLLVRIAKEAQAFKSFNAYMQNGVQNFPGSWGKER